GFSDAHWRLILAGHEQHVNVRDLGEIDDGVGTPFPAGHALRPEGNLLEQAAAQCLDDIAMDLMAHPFGVDHHAGVVADGNAIDLNAPAVRINADIDDPDGPRGAKTRPFAVDIPGVCYASSTQQAVVTRDAAAAGRVRLPACALCRGGQ